MKKTLLCLALILCALVLLAVPAFADGATKVIEASWIETIGDQTYTGDPVCPELVVKDGADTLTLGEDYTVEWEANTAVGQATVTVKGIGSYSGEAAATFAIKPKTVLGNEFAPVVYTGSEITPLDNFKIYDGGYVLVAGTDYEVAYADNVNAGTATATVTFKGNYSGSLVYTFEIKPKELTNFTASIDTQEYTGSAVEPAFDVKDGAKTLEKDTDYTVKFEDNTDNGEAKAIITGIGNYSGEKTVTFDIVKTISGSYNCDAAFTYDGKEQKITGFSFDFDLKTLEQDTDFEIVNYQNNVKAGSATAEIVGKGYYKGTATVTFTIAPKDISSAELQKKIDDVYYSGKEQKPAFTLKDGSRILNAADDYTFEYSDNTEIGTAKITITGKGNYTGTKEISFVILEQIDISGLTLTEQTTREPFNCNTITPSFKLWNGKTQLLKTTDYTVTVADNAAVGTATVTITGVGIYKGTKIFTFEIVERKSILTGNFDISGVEEIYGYTGSAITPEVTVKENGVELEEGTDFKVTYANNRSKNGVATVTVTGIGFYKGEKTLNFQIKQSLGDDTVKVSFKDPLHIATGKEITPQITVSIGGKTLTDKEDYTVTYKDNVEVGTATAVISGKGVYTGEKSVTFTICEAPDFSDTSKLVISPIPDQIFTGEKLAPEITVTWDGIKLTNGIHYVTSYENTIKLDSEKNIGTVTVTGVNGCTGTATADFRIVQPTDFIELYTSYALYFATKTGVPAEVVITVFVLAVLIILVVFVLLCSRPFHNTKFRYIAAALLAIADAVVFFLLRFEGEGEEYAFFGLNSIIGIIIAGFYYVWMWNTHFKRIDKNNVLVVGATDKTTQLTRSYFDSIFSGNVMNFSKQMLFLLEALAFFGIGLLIGIVKVSVVNGIVNELAGELVGKIIYAVFCFIGVMAAVSKLAEIRKRKKQFAKENHIKSVR